MVADRYHPNMIVILSFLLCAWSATAQNCFYPHGGIAQDYGVCNMTSSQSKRIMCCPIGWACTAADLCVSTNSSQPTYIYGACGYSTDNCPNFCNFKRTSTLLFLFMSHVVFLVHDCVSSTTKQDRVHSQSFRKRPQARRLIQRLRSEHLQRKRDVRKCLLQRQRHDLQLPV